jgi:hypothetical protein
MLVIVIIHTIRIDGTDGIGNKIVAGGAISIDSTTDCIEHDNRGDCIDCDGGVEDRGCCSPMEGGQYFWGSGTTPPMITLGPSRPEHADFPGLDASEGIRGFSGSEPATYKFPPSM